MNVTLVTPEAGAIKGCTSKIVQSDDEMELVSNVKEENHPLVGSSSDAAVVSIEDVVVGCGVVVGMGVVIVVGFRLVVVVVVVSWELVFVAVVGSGRLVVGSGGLVVGSGGPVVVAGS